jgi:hypothetical protein
MVGQPRLPVRRRPTTGSSQRNCCMRSMEGLWERPDQATTIVHHPRPACGTVAGPAAVEEGGVVDVMSKAELHGRTRPRVCRKDIGGARVGGSARVRRSATVPRPAAALNAADRHPSAHASVGGVLRSTRARRAYPVMVRPTAASEGGCPFNSRRVRDGGLPLRSRFRLPTLVAPACRPAADPVRA